MTAIVNPDVFLGALCGKTRLPASCILLPLGVALHYPEMQTGGQGSYLGSRQVCDLLAQGSVFTWCCLSFLHWWVLSSLPGALTPVSTG